MRNTSRIDGIPTYTNLLFMRNEYAHIVRISAFAYTMIFVQRHDHNTVLDEGYCLFNAICIISKEIR